MRKQCNTIYQKSFVGLNQNQKRLTLANISSNLIETSFLQQNSYLDIDEILVLITKDSNSNIGPPYNGVKVLCTYIRRNRNSLEEIIKKLSGYLKKYKNLNVNLVINVVNSILVLLTEKSQIMNFLDMILPILVRRLYDNFSNWTLIENLNNTIGKLIKIGGIYIQRLVEGFIDELFDNLIKYDPKSMHDNIKFALIVVNWLKICH